MPMWGVDDQGRCLCGGIDPRTRKACNAGKHSRDEESWKSGREYRPGDFSEEDNIALALGPWRSTIPQTWLVCLDFDAPLVSPLMLTSGFSLPDTLTQRSPRGLHWFYTVLPFEALGNWVDAFQTKFREGWALDIRYARGRINVAPSRSAFGSYEWLDEREPVPLPAEFIQRILRERRLRGLPVESRWHRGDKRP
jgi:hypothetical protein